MGKIVSRKNAKQLDDHVTGLWISNHILVISACTGGARPKLLIGKVIRQAK